MSSIKPMKYCEKYKCALWPMKKILTDIETAKIATTQNLYTA